MYKDHYTKSTASFGLFRHLIRNTSLTEASMGLRTTLVPGWSGHSSGPTRRRNVLRSWTCSPYPVFQQTAPGKSSSERSQTRINLSITYLHQPPGEAPGVNSAPSPHRPVMFTEPAWTASPPSYDFPPQKGREETPDQRGGTKITFKIDSQVRAI